MIDFTGGEPLLNKELPQILSYAKQKGFFVKLSTNGYLYPDLAEDLKGTFTRIYFSFDTASDKEYKIIRGIDGYERLLKSIKIAKDLKEDVCLSCTLTNETIKNISSIAEFCKENKVIAYIHPCFSYFKNEQLSKINIKHIKKYFWHPYVRVDLSDLKYYINGGNDINKPSCKAGKSVFAITPDNCLFVPCFHKGVKKVKIDDNLYSLYHSKEWDKLFANAGRYEFCKGCNLPCYLGASPLDKIDKYFFKELLSYTKFLIERSRN